MAGEESGGGSQPEGTAPIPGQQPPTGGRSPRWRTWQVILAIAAPAILAAGVALIVRQTSKTDHEATTGTTTETTIGVSTSTAATTGTSPSTAARTADDDLAGFFAAAQRVDARIKSAAALVNGGIRPGEIIVDQATIDAVKAIDEKEAAMAIPAGLPPDLLLKVLVVQSDLDSRSAALNAVDRVDPGIEVTPGTYPNTGQNGRYVLPCLKNGTQAAAQFASDVAAAHAVATSTSSIEVAAPGSRAAGELAIRLTNIQEMNYGCMSCGGQRLSTLAPITWHQTPGPSLNPPGPPWDGNLGGLLFHATYTPGKGWSVELNAC